MAQDKKPTHRLVIVDKLNTKNKTYAGSLWDEGGWFSLKLSPGVHLSAADQDRYYFNVSRNNEYGDTYQPRRYSTDVNGDIPPGAEQDARDDSDIPF